jgi:hypothetical protein
MDGGGEVKLLSESLNVVRISQQAMRRFLVGFPSNFCFVSTRLPGINFLE